MDLLGKFPDIDYLEASCNNKSNIPQPLELELEHLFPQNSAHFNTPSENFDIFSTPIAQTPLLYAIASIAFGVILLTLVISLVKSIISSCRQFLMVSVQATGGCGSFTNSLDDQVHLHLLRWIGLNLKGFQNEKVLPKTIKGSEKPTEENSSDSDDDDDFYNQITAREECKLGKTVGYGLNYLLYKNTLITVERKMTEATLNYRTQEILTLSTYFWRKSVLQEILEKAKPKPKKIDEKKLVIYKANCESECWNTLGNPKKKRPLDSLIMDSSVTKNLLDDINEFLSLEDWYVERGIPYRRGYLLYGPPGCGKSSIIKSLAGHLGYDISIISLSQKLTDDSMTELLNSAPSKSILLMEDIDAAFLSRQMTNEASSKETNLAFEGCSQSGLTFRGLLNALDGVASADNGQLVFMTTNYPDRLDPALIRPGRVDLKILIDHPNDFQFEGMFKRFYPDASDDMKKSFLKAIRNLKDLKISMAMLQGLMLVYKKNPQGAIDNVKKHFDEQFSNTNLAKCHDLYI